jgi:ATP-dependent Clp protease adaptor protein ClpS
VPAGTATPPTAVQPPQAEPPSVAPIEETRTRELSELLPPYRVQLHNDEHNAMDHVVDALLKTIPHMTTDRAAEIMLQAHNHGQATVITCPLELAELYRERLESFGLTATIERA